MECFASTVSSRSWYLGGSEALTCSVVLVPGMTQPQLARSTHVSPLKSVPAGQSHPDSHTVAETRSDPHVANIS